MELVIELPNFSALNAYIHDRIGRLRDTRPPLERIRDDFYDMEKAWFESEGGSQWQALSPRYAAWKNRTYPGKTILRRTDRMYNVATGQPGDYDLRGSELHIRMGGAPYWRAHDEGTGRLPVRKILSEQIQVRKIQWHQWVTDWLRV